MAPDPATGFDLNRIVAETFVQQVQYHDTVESTNTTALTCWQETKPATPLLVLTAEQTAGRGRGSNSWWSAAGALTFSVILEPGQLELPERDWPQMSLMTGLAICLALDEFLPNQQLLLKWPNDVYLDGNKLSGVLVEVAPRSPRALVIGIGINVNNSCRSGPAELQSLATSMADVSQQQFQLVDVLIGVLQQLEKQLTRLINQDPTRIDDWQQRSALTGQTVEVTAESQQTCGICQGIDTDGALLVQTEAGQQRVVSGIVSQVQKPVSRHGKAQQS